MVPTRQRDELHLLLSSAQMIENCDSETPQNNRTSQNMNCVMSINFPKRSVKLGHQFQHHRPITNSIMAAEYDLGVD